MAVENVFASVAVKDLGIAEAWYSKLLGQSPSKPMPEVLEWKLAGGGGLQVYRLPERAGHGSLTLAVRDLDAEISKLEAMGADTSERPSSTRVRTVMVTDPDGNHVALAEAFDALLLR